MKKWEQLRLCRLEFRLGGIFLALCFSLICDLCLVLGDIVVIVLGSVGLFVGLEGCACAM